MNREIIPRISITKEILRLRLLQPSEVQHIPMLISMVKGPLAISDTLNMCTKYKWNNFSFMRNMRAPDKVRGRTIVTPKLCQVPNSTAPNDN